MNALDGYNRTALHYAAEKEAFVEVLLEYGANPNALMVDRDTPATGQPLRTMLSVCGLLESGASVNALDYNNDTPLAGPAAMKEILRASASFLITVQRSESSTQKARRPSPAWWLC